MHYEVTFYFLRQKIRPLFEDSSLLFGLFFLRDKRATELFKKMGIKYLSYRDGEDGFIIKFEVFDKKSFLWAKIKYGI